MLIDERERNLRDFEAGKYGCIVHVGMLGEGYDHPPLSIAAIFRPYRTRSPYEQFIGRTLRVIPGSTEDDNIAHVISHIGLNLDDLWVYFKHEIRDAERLREFDASEEYLDDGEDSDGGTGVRSRRSTPHVSDEEIGSFDIDHFLPPSDHRRQVLEERLPELENVIDEIRKAGFKLPDPKLRQPFFQDLPVMIFGFTLSTKSEMPNASVNSTPLRNTWTTVRIVMVGLVCAADGRHHTYPTRKLAVLILTTFFPPAIIKI